MNSDKNKKSTLRLLYPQWQGGFDETEFPGQIYPLGARLLSFLAPKCDTPLIEVPVTKWVGDKAAKDGGVFYRQEILRQIKAARSIIDGYMPDRVITFGGDCLISQASFAYLNEHYNGDIGFLWIDAHPDITTPKEFDHAHAMVLGNLLGAGEPLMASEVKLHLKPEQICYVGVDGVLPHEERTINELSLYKIPSQDVLANSDVIASWIRSRGFKRVAIHLDLDVLDPRKFRSLLFANPNVDQYIDAEHGKLDIQTIGRILQDIDRLTDVMGISFAEYMPWDALNLETMLSKLSFLK